MDDCWTEPEVFFSSPLIEALNNEESLTFNIEENLAAVFHMNTLIIN